VQKLFIGLLMALFSSLSHAEWFMVIESNKAAAYIDLDRIVQEKDNIKVWVLLNYTEDQEANVGGEKIVFKSVMSHTEFECKKRLYKEGAIHYFSGDMGQGKSAHKDFGRARFEDIVPNAFIERFFNLACKNKKR
jgi:hypothetical protein